MIVLNLGCGHPGEDMPGFVNLDRNPAYGDGTGWKADDGLRRWADGEVDAVTISHLMMYIPLHTWALFFDEVCRVLKPGGHVRVTEDVILEPESRHWFGHRPLHASWKGREVKIMSPGLVIHVLYICGIPAREVGREETSCPIDIRQDRHGGPPHVFFVEGVKP